MASIQWLWCSHRHKRPPLWGWKEKGPSSSRMDIRFRLPSPSCCCIQEQEPYAAAEANTRRRRVILQMAVAAAFAVPNALAVPQTPNGDVPEDFRFYTDDANKFKVLLPKGWQVGTGEPNGFKSVTAFYPEEPSSSNVSVVITGLGPDFTRMESFGKVEAFAETLVSGLDRSWQRPPGVAAKLIDAKAANGFYYIEYSLQNPGESGRHLYSAIGMASNGWYNRLYTVTGQVVEEETDKYGSKIQMVVASFSFI
ncbi:hypothetical protein L6164_015173 [Bauhinia variegata]|uniref:Uncharacterized protein n=1 Tax=Bauhinia variegata TaxID=167791 RepID=A0ACB9NLQ5_BAUVA|nr:hypothetical protein L6164_015173 [Bauhinia variegata]